MLLLSLHAHDDLAGRLETRGVPTVCGGRPTTSHPACVVDVANRAGGRSAVEHLLERGRRRIALVAGPQDMSSGHDRLCGAQGRLGGRRPPVEHLLVVFGDYSEASGEVGVREPPPYGERPDAVFAASDLMAVGALRALRSAGLRVPEDVAVVGFDDSPVCRHTEPSLPCDSRSTRWGG